MTVPPGPDRLLIAPDCVLLILFSRARHQDGFDLPLGVGEMVGTFYQEPVFGLTAVLDEGKFAAEF